MWRYTIPIALVLLVLLVAASVPASAATGWGIGLGFGNWGNSFSIGVGNYPYGYYRIGAITRATMDPMVIIPGLTIVPTAITRTDTTTRTIEATILEAALE